MAMPRLDHLEGSGEHAVQCVAAEAGVDRLPWPVAFRQVAPGDRGRLERRLRTLDDQVEAHRITFPNSEDLAAYRADPRCSAAAPLLEASGAAVELLAVRDV